MYANLFAQVSDIAPSWSSCFGYILTITGSSGHLSQPIISTSARGTRDSLPGVLLKPGETKDCKNGRGSLTKMAPMQLATLATLVDLCTNYQGWDGRSAKVAKMIVVR